MFYKKATSHIVRRCALIKNEIESNKFHTVEKHDIQIKIFGCLIAFRPIKQTTIPHMKFANKLLG